MGVDLQTKTKNKYGKVILHINVFYLDKYIGMLDIPTFLHVLALTVLYCWKTLYTKELFYHCGNP